MEETELDETKEESELPNGEKPKITFAWKWLIVCGVLLVILIVLAILVSVLRTGEVWPDTTSMVKNLKTYLSIFLF